MSDDDKIVDLDEGVVKEFVDGTNIELGFEYSEDMLPDLTEKQRQIFKLRLRGLSQSAIAKIVGISQQAVSKHWKLIKKKFQKMGDQVNQPAIVGESVSLYNEVGERSWDLFYLAKDKEKYGDALRALKLIVDSRKEMLNMLMELGLLKRAAIEHEHKVTASPLIEQWTDGEAQKKMEIVTNVIGTQLEDLEEPEPPMLTAGDEDIEDAEIIEED